jgi:hypothetical protein
VEAIAMSALPAIPEPSTLDAEDAAALALRVERWLAATDDLKLVDECRARVAAIEAYLAKRGEPIGEIQRAARLTEIRIGELLGPAPGRGRAEMNTHAHSFIPRLRKEFRGEAADRDLTIKVVQELITPEPEHDGWQPTASRRAVLERVVPILKRRDRQQADGDARLIVAGEHQIVEGESWMMILGDFREVLGDMAPGSVHAIVSDPPYPRESLPLWGDLGEHAARLLLPQGISVTLTGQLWLPEVLRLLDGHLTYAWTYCQLLPGSNSRIGGRQIRQAWKPWLAYSKGAWPVGLIDPHADVLPEVPKAKGDYHWQQTIAPAQFLIERLTPRDGLILDPFAGVASYGVAAIQAGRGFVGVERDEERFEKACERLKAAAT